MTVKQFDAKPAKLAERMMPHSLEAERALLGALLIRPEGFEHVAAMLTPEAFFRAVHRMVYAVIADLINVRKVAVDVLTVKAALEQRGQLDDVGAVYLSDLTTGVPRSTNVAHYAAIIVEKARLRALIALGSDLMAESYAEDARSSAIVTTADRALLTLQQGRPGDMVDMREAGVRVYARIERNVERKGQIHGVDTGFESINQLTYGWTPGDLIVIAARPSIGKSIFSINTAVAAARTGKKVAIFSLEMRTEQLEYRLLTSLSGVPATRIKSGYLAETDYARIAEATAVFNDLAIFILDRGRQTVWDVRASCRRVRADHGLDLVIVDYVQLMAGSLDRRGSTRQEEVTDISRRMKDLADELTVPVLLVSQLNRGADSRADPRPKLSDLRESGSLEQDADLVCFLHRKHHRVGGCTNFIVEKGRNIETGTVNLTVDLATQQFTDGGEEEPDAPKSDPQPAKAPRFWKR